MISYLPYPFNFVVEALREKYDSLPGPREPKGAQPHTSMSHALPSAPPSRRLAGLATIIGLHVGAFYLLANGLSRESVQAVLNPVQTRLIQEVKAPPPPPPPPRRDIVRQPARTPPPPLYAPPPEVAVAPAPVVDTVAAAPVQAPPAPAAPPAPPPPAAAPSPPAVLSAGVVCPNSAQVRASTRYPAVAQRRNITGDVLVEFLVAASGVIEDIQVLGQANGILASAAIEATRKFHCESQGRPVRVQVSYSFQMQ